MTGSVETAVQTSLFDRLKTYRSDQGRYVRLASFWSLAILWFYGCYRLEGTLHDLRASWASIFRARLLEEIPLIERPLTLSMTIAGVVYLAGLAVLQMFLNRPKIAETLIETEAELRKVTWPTSKDTIQASLVVLVTVIVLLAMLAGFDIVLARVFDFLLASGG